MWIFMLSNSRRITDKVATLIYETQEECNEVKKNKRKRERKKKQALHCDREYAAVIELDLRKFKKTFSAPPGQFSHHNHPFYSLRCQPFIAVTMARLAKALNWVPQNIFVLKPSLFHCEPSNHYKRLISELQCIW